MSQKRSKISPQYLTKEDISITILSVKSPNLFIVKECPSINISSVAKNFLEAEEVMQKYYLSVESCFFQLPLKDSIVIALIDSKFYRGRVHSILNLSNGYLFKIYLLDYGKEYDVPRQRLYEIHKDFLAHPFQAVEFRLLGIEPASYVMSSTDLTFSYGPVESWDPSSYSYIDNLQKSMNNAYIKVKGVGTDHICGFLYISFDEHATKCLNDELLKKKYALYNKDCWKDVVEIDIALEKMFHHESDTKSVCSSTDGVGKAGLSDSAKFSIQNFIASIEAQLKERESSYLLPEKSKSRASTHSSRSSTNISGIGRGRIKSFHNEVDAFHSSPERSKPVASCHSPRSPSNISEIEKTIQYLHDEQRAESTAYSPNSSELSPLIESLSFSDDIELKLKQCSVGKQSDTEKHLERLLKFQKLRAQKVSIQPVAPHICTDKIASNFTPSSQKVSPKTSDENLLDVSKCKVMEKSQNVLDEVQPEKSFSDTEKQLQRLLKLKTLRANNESLSSMISTSDNSTKDLNPDKHTEKVSPCKTGIEQRISSPEGHNTNNNISEKEERLQRLQKFKKLRDKNKSLSDMFNLPDNLKMDYLENKDNIDKVSSYNSNCSLKENPNTVKTEVKHNHSNKENVIQRENVPKCLQSVQAIKDNFEVVKVETNVLSTNEILKEISSDTSDSDDLLLYASVKKGEAEPQAENDSSEQIFETGTEKENSELKFVDFSEESLWERQNVPAVQIGNAVSKPILSIEDSSFHPSLIQTLKVLKFCGPSCIQSVVWPAVAKGRSLVAIAPPRAGKTVAYLLPLISNLIAAVPYSSLPLGNGPVTIILCSSWKKAQAIYNLCCIFKGNSKIKIHMVSADAESKRNKITLMNGCDVFISVPFCLLQLFKSNTIHFSRCCHFILDDGDYLVAQHKVELKEILLHFVNGVKTNETIPQFILCAERWNKNFSFMIEKLMVSPLLLFTSFLESAIYAHVPILAHVCSSDERKRTLLGFLGNVEKAVICTSNIDDALDIHSFLRYEDIKSYLVTEQMEHFISDEIIKDWKSAKFCFTSHCLVITDASLTKTCISNANCLIHYDIPLSSRLQFGNRFSCIAGHIKQQNEERNCICHILLSEECYTLAPDIVDIIQRSDGIVSEDLKKLLSKNSQIPQNAEAPLCHFKKAFGSCKLANCDQRHFVDSEMDHPMITPPEGDIQALVTHVLDASHYYVRIMKYLLPDHESPVSLSSVYADIGFQLKKFYSCSSNQREVKIPIVGQQYVLQLGDVFYRVKIMDAGTESYPSQKPKLFFVDEGWIKCYDEGNLYILSDEINLPPPIAVEAYLCNVITPDSCLEWNPQTTRFVSDVIKHKEIFGKIVLCLGHTVWLHPVVMREKLSFPNAHLSSLKLDSVLKDSAFAKENKNHIKMLLRLSKGKVPLPELIVNKNENLNVQPSINYAFLECNILDNVYVSSIISPHLLYVQRAKFVECLDELLAEMNSQVKKKLIARCATVHKGMHCIAPFSEDDRFYRAVITDIIPDTDDVNLFYVDFGDTGVTSKSNIYVLPSSFMLLPFQAIECELAGICAAHGGWTDKIVDTLNELTRDNNGDMKILQLKVYSKSSSYGSYGNRYLVDIWDCKRSLSEYLLQAGLANSAENVFSVDSPTDIPTEEVFDVPQGFISSSDSEIHPDEKDAAALFCGVLSKLLLQEVKAKTGFAITESASDDENFNPEVESFVKRMQSENNNIKNMHTINEKNDALDTVHAFKNSASSRLTAPIIPRERTSKSSKPLITWWDTAQHLNITIHVKDLKIYELQILNDSFSFRTTVECAHYSTDEKFYSNIYPEKATEKVTLQGLCIVLLKQELLKWPHLTKDKGKFLHIKYDFNHLEDFDSDTYNIIHQKTEFDNSKNCEVASYLSDESDDSSTDEEEKYIQSRKDMAEYKDPFNPLS